MTHPKTAGAGPLADFSIGQPVMTREGYPGVVTDIHEGPADLTTVWVTLDGGMGGGEYAEAELSPLPTQSTAARNEAAIIEANVAHTAADDYPELGTILSDRLPPALHQRMANKMAAAEISDPYMLVWVSGEDEKRNEAGFSNWEAAHAYGVGLSERGDVWPNKVSSETQEEYPGREYVKGVIVRSNTYAVILGWEGGHTASRAEAGAAWTHADDPEWDDDLNYPINRTKSDAAKTCDGCGATYTGDGTGGGLHDHWTARTALYLPPVPKSEQRASTTDLPESQRAGYQEGLEQGKVGLTREPSQPEDLDFMAGYAIGWAEGVTVAREPANSWDIDDLGKDQTADVPSTIPTAFGPIMGSKTASQGPCPICGDVMLSQVAGMTCMVCGTIVPMVSADLLPGEFTEAGEIVSLGMPLSREAGEIKDWIAENGQPGSRFTYDWCRFRRNSHCWLPSGLDEAASERAGYAVWIPMDRGYCWRSAWETQEKCSTGMPGPKVDGGFTDATVPFDKGGQRNGTPDPSWTGYADTYTPRSVPGGVLASRGAALVVSVTSLLKEGSFEFTAAWKDVRAKAKKIREAGGVRIAAARDNVIVGHVKGDNAVYETEIVSFPGRRNAATWSCGCKWGSYSWGRSGPWKRYEGRMCSHALALQYEAQSRGMNGKEIRIDSDQPSWMSGEPKAYVPARQMAASLHIAGPLDDGLRSRVRSASTLESAAAAMMTLARREEPKVVDDIQTLVNQNHGEMVGLEHRLKSESSLLRKMKAEATLFRNPGECAMNMSDTLRFTALLQFDTYTQDSNDILNGLRARGYKTRVKNFWGRGDAYNGVNIALTSPNGHPVELQFHTEETFAIKQQQVHPIYEAWRTESDPNKKAILGYDMRNKFDMAHRPPGALGIEGLKKQPFVPWNQINWSRAASLMTEGLVDAADFRYLALHYIDGDPDTPDEVYAVLRTDEVHVEIWEGGQWVEDSDFGRYIFLGDPTSEEVSAEEAADFIASLTPTRLASHHVVSEQVDDDAPVHLAVSQMLTSGARYTDVREVLVSSGVEAPAKVVSAARKQARYITEQEIRDGSLDINALRLVDPDGTVGPSFVDWVKQAKDGKNEGVPYSEHGDDRLKDAGVSVAKDDKGYYVHTHRARGKSHDTVAKIPNSEIKSIEATGSLTAAAGEGWAINGKPYTDGVWIEVEPDKWYRGSAPGECPSSCYASLSEGKWEWMARASTFIGAPHENRAGAKGAARGSSKTLEQAQAKAEAALAKDHEYFTAYEDRQRAKGLIASVQADPCTACSGTGEQRNGHECYLCDASGQGSEERRSRAAGMTSANPANGLEVGQDDSIGEPGSKVHTGMEHLGEFWPIPYLMTTAKEQKVEFSGVALVARDTGRVLFLQRALTDNDDNGGKWEFPGGHHEDGDTTSLHAGIREWEEEVGQKFPEGTEVINTWTSADGIYRGHVVAIDEEADLELHVDRVVDNPDEDGFEQAAWWAIDDARKNPALREECKKTPWDLLKVPVLTKAASVEWLWDNHEEIPDGHR
jgi:8-oxo-dGTP pyrophosphatase MutT (NUDIX family)